MLTTKLKASYILIIFVITLPTLTNILFSIYKFKILNKLPTLFMILINIKLKVQRV